LITDDSGAWPTPGGVSTGPRIEHPRIAVAYHTGYTLLAMSDYPASMTFKLKQMVGVVLWATLAVALSIAARGTFLGVLIVMAIGCVTLAVMLAYDIMRGIER
jgi:hypothetical protein